MKLLKPSLKEGPAKVAGGEWGHTILNVWLDLRIMRGDLVQRHSLAKSGKIIEVMEEG
jgi:hypothetical protein